MGIYNDNKFDAQLTDKNWLKILNIHHINGQSFNPASGKTCEQTTGDYPCTRLLRSGEKVCFEIPPMNKATTNSDYSQAGILGSEHRGFDWVNTCQTSNAFYIEYDAVTPYNEMKVRLKRAQIPGFGGDHFKKDYGYMCGFDPDSWQGDGTAAPGWLSAVKWDFKPGQNDARNQCNRANAMVWTMGWDPCPHCPPPTCTDKDGSGGDVTCAAGFSTKAGSTQCTDCANDGTECCTVTKCTGVNANAPTNGKVAWSDTDKHASVATFSCNDGFLKAGDASVTCVATTADVPWPTPGVAPTCTGEAMPEEGGRFCTGGRGFATGVVEVLLACVR